MRKKGFKKGILFFLLLLVVLWITAPMIWVNKAAAAPEKIRLSMGGSNTGTWVYMFCATLADHWKRYIPDLDITVIATAGSNANYIPMDKGELDLGAASNVGDFYALQGMYFAKTKISNFCSMLPVSKAFTQAFTYADSPIKTWRDFDGKTIHVGAKASPAFIINEEYFKILGINVKYVFSTPTEAIDMMKDQRGDAMVYAVGAPWSGILDLATDKRLKFISMKPEEQKKIAEASPISIPDTITAKTYPFQNEDVQTMSTLYTINVRPGISEEVVYKLTKVAWEHWDELVKTVEAAKWGKPKSILDMIAPVHPGAAKYYREIGIQIPDRLIWKKK